MRRRDFLRAGAAAVTAAAAGRTLAQHNQHGGGIAPAAPSAEPFAKLQGGAPNHLTPEQEAQRVTASPAPAGPAGRRISRAAPPLPRSQMAWATAWAGRM